MRSIPRNLSLMALALVAAPALVAQESTGQVVGTVKTKAGEPMAGDEFAADEEDLGMPAVGASTEAEIERPAPRKPAAKAGAKRKSAPKKTG